MNKNNMFWIGFISMTLYSIYVIFSDIVLLIIQLNGVPMILYHPYLVGIDSASKVEIVPQILRLIYIFMMYILITMMAFKLKKIDKE